MPPFPLVQLGHDDILLSFLLIGHDIQGLHVGKDALKVISLLPSNRIATQAGCIVKKQILQGLEVELFTTVIASSSWCHSVGWVTNSRVPRAMERPTDRYDTWWRQKEAGSGCGVEKGTEGRNHSRHTAASK